MQEVIEIFKNPHPIAVVGVSDKKFGGAIYKELLKRHYDVYPVNPRRDTFNGNKCYSSLKDLPDKISSAVLCVAADAARRVVDDAIAADFKYLWFQQGNDFSQAVTQAEAGGIQSVSGKCILMYAEPVGGIHAFHKFLARLFKKY